MCTSWHWKVDQGMSTACFLDWGRRKRFVRFVLITHYAPHLVNLRDHSVHHFSLKWAENNGLILDWIENKPSPRLDHTCSDVVNSGDSNDKAIPEIRNTSRWETWAVLPWSLWYCACLNHHYVAQSSVSNRTYICCLFLQIKHTLDMSWEGHEIDFELCICLQTMCVCA